MATETVAKPRTSMRVHVQKFGTFLSGMIMPNIGAFIAWGFITALFIPAGFFPNAELGKLVGPMITYLLPLLIGYTGGRMVYGVRGGVVGAVATMGVIVGTDIPMFIGAMILGPLTAWIMMKLDKIWEGRVKPGFEMLIDNFSAGIVAAAMAVVGMLVVGPIVKAFSNGASAVVEFLVTNGLLPFTSIFIEPAKVLFLNNAVNHGILTPLGTQQALEQGKSILFLLEANPGPGFGILLAFSFFGKGLAKASAPGAAVIQFVGGIHEIYFPYVLMKPMTIFAAIGGGMTGIFTLVVTGAGLRSPAAPGSIIAVYASTARDSYVGVTLSVLFATTVSFLIASVVLKASKAPAEDDLDQATHRMEALKGKKSSVSAALIGEGVGASGVAVLATPIKNIVFACDAGMGSSAMGASVLRNKIKAAGFPDVKVTNSAIANLTDTYDVVITHQDLTERAKPATASAVHVSVDNFMNSPRYDEIVELVEASNTEAGTTDDGPCRGRRRHRPPRPPRQKPRRVPPASWWPKASSSTARDHAGRRDRRGRAAPAGPRRRRLRLRGRHARTRGIRLHLHGQLPGHPARHQRREGPHHEVGGLRCPLPERHRLERQGSEVRRRRGRRQQRTPAHPVLDRQGLHQQGPGGPARGGHHG